MLRDVSHQAVRCEEPRPNPEQRSNGFVQLRRGIIEHVQAGNLSEDEFAAFVWAILNADHRTGTWRASGADLARAFRRSRSWGQRMLRHLTAKGYLLRESADRLRHLAGPAEVRISKYFRQQEPTLPFDRPASVQTQAASPVTQGCVSSDAVSLTRIPTRRKPPAAAQPGDPRHRQFVELASETFKGKHGGQPPTWSERDYASLTKLLRRNPNLTLDELRRRWGNFLGSSDPFIQGQGDSLGFFCTSFDRFLEGPLLSRTTSSRVNRGEQRYATNRAAAGLN